MDAKSLHKECNLAQLYEAKCNSAPKGTRIVVQSSQKVEAFSSLFYVPVRVNGHVQINGMLDSGSMACTISKIAEEKIGSAGVLPEKKYSEENIILIGCGGQHTQPEGFYDLEIQFFGIQCVVPCLVVPGQRDDLILGSNIVKHLIHELKSDSDYWDIASRPDNQFDGDIQQFLSMFTGVERWKGEAVPDKIGTVKLTRAVVLLPEHEHLVWGRLPPNVPMSPGSTVIVEPTNSKAMPRDILVGRLVTPLWGDRWVPMTVVNPTNKVITLKRNCKIADVFPCIASEDFEIFQGLHVTPVDGKPDVSRDSCPVNHIDKSLLNLGLGDIDINWSQISDDCKSKLTQLVADYQDIFSKHPLDCGEAKGCVHRIRLTDDRPFRLPYRRVPPAHYDKLRQVLTDMEERGIIRKSSSEYASPLVMVWKKDGGLRICTDFRWLNARTIKDAHPLPHQADCLAALGGNCFFSTMDLTSGFYNIPMNEDDKKYTAFTTPLGLHEYNRLPQGLCNSPASFMRMMLGIFGDMNFSKLLCYLDDLLVFAPSENEALSRLHTVFQRLRENNLKLSPKKCHLLQRRVKFLGHIIDSGGVSVDPAKVEVITRITAQDLMDNDGCTPSVKRIKSFLGMVFYYQHFIPNCSSISKPLFGLTAGQKRRGKLSKDRKFQGTYRKLGPSDWTTECQVAFDQLKAALLESVMLAHPDFDEPFILSVDASLDGLGAVLSQVPKGELRARPIAFASKTLSASQRKYPAHRLEFMALKWSVCEKFSHWLRGHKFTIWTDNNPLTYLLTKPKPDAYELRWVSKLASYTFDLKHLPGKANVVADALSREPFVKPIGRRLLDEPYSSLIEECSGVSKDCVHDVFRLSSQAQSNQPMRSLSQGTCFDMDEIRALCQSYCSWTDGAESRALHLVHHVQTISVCRETLPAFSVQELRRSQQEDPTIAKVLSFLIKQRRPSRRDRHGASAQVLRLLKQWNKLEVRDDVMYRVTKDPLSKKKRFQYVLPGSLMNKALSGIHDLAGHQGQDRTLSLARQRFYWPDMEKNIKDYVKCCQRCVFAKTPEPAARAPLESIKSSAPMELVCIDFWSAENDKQCSVDVLVVTDHFTKLAHAFPCTNQTAKQVARKIWDSVFCIYGFPERIHSDQGTNFESNLIAELLHLAGVAKSHTTAYHPMGNGGTERFNRTLGNMLRTLPLKAKHQWPQQIQTLTFAYNATVHETTGYAPFFLMFGRIPRLPVDIMFNQVLDNPEVADYDSYARSLLSYLKNAMHIAQKHSSVEQQHQAHQYNKRVKGTHLSVGDRVLVANKSERGKRKLADKWEDGVFTVVDVNPGIHVYKIKDATGRMKVVHRNLLLEVNFLPISGIDEGSSSSEPDQPLIVVESDQNEVDQTTMPSQPNKPDLCDSSVETSTVSSTESSYQSSFDSDEKALSPVADTTVLGDLVPSLHSDVVDTADTDTTHYPGTADKLSSDDRHAQHSDEIAQNLPPSPDLLRTDASLQADAHAYAGLVKPIKTRVGRIVKSVNRLIESMVHIPVLRVQEV